MIQVELIIALNSRSNNMTPTQVGYPILTTIIPDFKMNNKFKVDQKSQIKDLQKLGGKMFF